MKRNTVLALAVAGIVAAPNAYAVEVAGDALSIYGKWHMSVDVSDMDGGAGSNTSISSNSSRLGFKGQHDLDSGMTAVWQIETEIRPDETGLDWASRNSYAGMKGGFGTLVFGHHDTPFKTVAGKWDMFADTVGDRRAILGASYNNNNKMNQRGKNALLYKNKFSDVELQAMYSTDGNDSSSGLVDNNDNDMTSIALLYNSGPLSAGLAQENWSNLDNAYGKVDGTRFTISYEFGAARVGAILETINGDTATQWSRDAMGVNGSYKTGNTTFKLQYLSADSADGTTDTGATMTSVGVFNKLDKQTEVYLAYATTDNETNAMFQAVDGGHGDEVKAGAAGASPSSFSAGMVFKF